MKLLLWVVVETTVCRNNGMLNVWERVDPQLFVYKLRILKYTCSRYVVEGNAVWTLDSINCTTIYNV